MRNRVAQMGALTGAYSSGGRDALPPESVSRPGEEGDFVDGADRQGLFVGEAGICGYLVSSGARASVRPRPGP
ncbi:hypothetical protein PCLA_01r0567 [Pseudomonas citronellolis]|nr:hypothetical protein PCLA_01r0567 [Pseudomonas citronellolis]